ncbi:MAG: hypothetical protein ACWA5W_08395, partial [Phycisphaerales bacterium]
MKPDEHTTQPDVDEPTPTIMESSRSIPVGRALRWTVPPGVSIVVHVVLIGAVAYIGMQIGAESGGDDRPAMVE